MSATQGSVCIELLDADHGWQTPIVHDLTVDRSALSLVLELALSVEDRTPEEDAAIADLEASPASS